MYDRRLLAKLSKCGWNVIRPYLKSGVLDDDAVPGASIAVHTYGDFLNFNPHLHAIVSDGCFRSDDTFRMAPGFMAKDLEKAFQHEVLKMLKKEGKINDAIIENLLSWRHSAFQVYIGGRILPDDETGLEKLAKCIIRACFSQERMDYKPVERSTDGVAKVICTSKDGRTRKTFDALDWLAQLVMHIPDRYEQTVRYYGYYSNKLRGLRKKRDEDDEIPTLIPGEMSSKEFRRNWARLIQKVYEVDPLVCPKCQGAIKIISIIDQPEIIQKILLHLNLWDTRNHDPPPESPSYIPELTCDDSDSQIPAYDYWN
ncbi:MAG: transposase [Desulfobacterales bacterium]|nr:transposase [Desulfobacterales bacterium]